jgi:hypothetical protein
MKLVQKHFSQQDWTDLVNGFQDLSLLQTWEYGEAKAHTGPWQVVRMCFWEGDLLVGACQAMVRPLPLGLGGLVWINRAPLWRRPGEEGDPALLVAMLAELRKYWVEERRLYLRVALPLEQGAAEPDFSPPPGYQWVHSSTGWASARLDLSLTQETLRRELKRKWRNQLNKAERLGILWEFSTSDEIFARTIGEYQTMVQKKGLATSLTPALLTKWQQFLPDDKKPWCALATHEGKLLMGVSFACYGSTSEILAGAITEAGRTVNACNFLLWQAIAKMQELGYRWFDLGGLNPATTPAGILRYKSGMGGTPYQLVPELEAYKHGLISRALRWYIRRRQHGTEA